MYAFFQSAAEAIALVIVLPLLCYASIWFAASQIVVTHGCNPEVNLGTVADQIDLPARIRGR